MSKSSGELRDFSQKPSQHGRDDYLRPYKTTVKGPNGETIHGKMSAGTFQAFNPSESTNQPTVTYASGIVGSEIEKVSALEKRDLAELQEQASDLLATTKAKKDSLFKSLRANGLWDAFDEATAIEMYLSNEVGTLYAEKKPSTFSTRDSAQAFLVKAQELADKVEEYDKKVYTLMENEATAKKNLEILLPLIQVFIKEKQRFDDLASYKLQQGSEIISLVSSLEWLEKDPSGGSTMLDSVDAIQKNLVTLTKLLDEEEVYIQKQKDISAQEDKEREEKERAEKELHAKETLRVQKASFLLSVAVAEIAGVARFLIPKITDTAIAQALTDAGITARQAEEKLSNDVDDISLTAFEKARDDYRLALDAANAHVDSLVPAPKTSEALDISRGWPASMLSATTKANPAKGEKAVTRWEKDGRPLDNGDQWSRVHDNFKVEFAKYLTFISTGDTLRKRKDFIDLIVIKNQIIDSLLDEDLDHAKVAISTFGELVSQAEKDWADFIKKEAEAKKIDDEKKSLEKELSTLSARFANLIETENKLFPVDAEDREPDMLVRTISSAQERSDEIKSADPLTQELLTAYKNSLGAVETQIHLEEKELAEKHERQVLKKKKLEEAFLVQQTKFNELREQAIRIEPYLMTTNTKDSTLLNDKDTFHKKINAVAALVAEVSGKISQDSLEHLNKELTGYEERLNYIESKISAEKLSPPHALNAIEGQMEQTRDGRTILLKDWQDKQRTNELDKSEKQERLKEAEKPDFQFFEDMFLRNPIEFRKIYSRKTWLEEEKGKKAIVDKIRGAKFREHRVTELEKEKGNLEEELAGLVLTSREGMTSEAIQALVERIREIRVQLVPIIERIDAFSKLPKEETTKEELDEYYKEFKEGKTLKITREVYSPSQDASLAHIPIAGHEMSRKEKGEQKIAIHHKKEYTQSEKRDTLNQEQIDALGKDEVRLTAQRPLGASSVVGGMTKSLNEGEAKKVKNAYDIRGIDDAIPNDEIERRRLEKEASRGAKVAKVLSSLSKYVGKHWRTMLTVGIVASSVAYRGGATAAETPKTGYKSPGEYDQMYPENPERWKDTLDVTTKKFAEDFTAKKINAEGLLSLYADLLHNELIKNHLVDNRNITPYQILYDETIPEMRDPDQRRQVSHLIRMVQNTEEALCKQTGRPFDKNTSPNLNETLREYLVRVLALAESVKK